MRKAKKNPVFRVSGSTDGNALLETKENGKWKCYNFDFTKHYEVIKPLLELMPEPEEEV